MSKVFTVFGATGNQGGSVINAIIAHSDLAKVYKLRAVTRDPSKPAAQALATKGVEIITADLDDRASVFRVVEGSTVVFGVTDFLNNADTEEQHGKTIADAAVAAGVEHLIWSSLPYCAKHSGGRLKVKQFDSKAIVEEYIRSLDINATFFMAGGFMQFCTIYFQPQEDGSLAANVPFDVTKARIPLIDAVADSGVFVAAILLAGSEVYGKRISGAYRYYTLVEMAEIVQSITGRKTTAGYISPEVMRGYLPPAIADAFLDNLALLGPEFGYYIGEPANSVDEAVDLVERTGAGKLTSWDDFVKRTSIFNKTG